MYATIIAVVAIIVIVLFVQNAGTVSSLSVPETKLAPSNPRSLEWGATRNSYFVYPSMSVRLFTLQTSFDTMPDVSDKMTRSEINTAIAKWYGSEPSDNFPAYFVHLDNLNKYATELVYRGTPGLRALQLLKLTIVAFANYSVTTTLTSDEYVECSILLSKLAIGIGFLVDKLQGPVLTSAFVNFLSQLCDYIPKVDPNLYVYLVPLHYYSAVITKRTLPTIDLASNPICKMDMAVLGKRVWYVFKLLPMFEILAPLSITSINMNYVHQLYLRFLTLNYNPYTMQVNYPIYTATGLGSPSSYFMADLYSYLIEYGCIIFDEQTEDNRGLLRLLVTRRLYDSIPSFYSMSKKFNGLTESTIMPLYDNNTTAIVYPYYQYIQYINDSAVKNGSTSQYFSYVGTRDEIINQKPVNQYALVPKSLSTVKLNDNYIINRCTMADGGAVMLNIIGIHQNPINVHMLFKTVALNNLPYFNDNIEQSNAISTDLTQHTMQDTPFCIITDSICNISSSSGGQQPKQILLSKAAGNYCGTVIALPQLYASQMSSDISRSVDKPFGSKGGKITYIRMSRHNLIIFHINAPESADGLELIGISSNRGIFMYSPLATSQKLTLSIDLFESIFNIDVNHLTINNTVNTGYNFSMSDDKLSLVVQTIGTTNLWTFQSVKNNA